MTKQEYKAWMEETKSSVGRWNMDEITYHNKGELLIYRGGENGKYITVSKDGVAQIGAYEGAVPHIGEAMFTVKATVQCKDFTDAVTRLVAAGGLEFLRDLLKEKCLKNG